MCENHQYSLLKEEAISLWGRVELEKGGFPSLSIGDKGVGPSVGVGIGEELKDNTILTSVSLRIQPSS